MGRTTIASATKAIYLQLEGRNIKNPEAYQKVWLILLHTAAFQQLSCLWPKHFHTASNLYSMGADTLFCLEGCNSRIALLATELLTRGTYFKIASGKENCDHKFTYI